jgi:hypothetical protein
MKYTILDDMSKNITNGWQEEERPFHYVPSAKTSALFKRGGIFDWLVDRRMHGP